MRCNSQSKNSQVLLWIERNINLLQINFTYGSKRPCKGRHKNNIIAGETHLFLQKTGNVSLSLHYRGLSGRINLSECITIGFNQLNNLPPTSSYKLLVKATPQYTCFIQLAIATTSCLFISNHLVSSLVCHCQTVIGNSNCKIMVQCKLLFHQLPQFSLAQWFLNWGCGS